MANKYLIHGAAFCGDGTTSAEAGSNGAAGAWNDINVLEGTAPAYGTLAAGDVVFIRSKTSGGADISRTLTGNINLGSSAATGSAWITWVLDGGTVWSGISGTLTFTHASSYTVTPRIYNEFVSRVEDAWKIAVTGTASCVLLQSASVGPFVLRNVLLDASGQTGAGEAHIYYGASGGFTEATFVNCGFKFRNLYTGCMFRCYYPSITKMVNPRMSVSTGGTVIFQVADVTRVEITGGEITGARAESGAMTIFTPNSSYRGEARIVGLKYPVTMAIAPDGSSMLVGTTFESIWCDAGFGSEYYYNYGNASSRDDGNFPTLDAYLPDIASTPWSWKVRPVGATRSNPFEMRLGKYYADTAGTKTITVEIMAANTYPGLTKDKVWIEVAYVDDSTGAAKCVDTFDAAGGALASSSAGWSLDFYGAISCSTGKRKLEITTPTAVKDGSMLSVRLCCSSPPGSTNDLIFVCPDVPIS